MPYVTTLTLRSGDRAALDGVVEDLKHRAERKGIDLRGPHPRPPTSFRVPLYRRPSGDGGTFPDWEYTVFERRLEIAGHDEAVRWITELEFPTSVRIEVVIDQVRSVGSN